MQRAFSRRSGACVRSRHQIKRAAAKRKLTRTAAERNSGLIQPDNLDCGLQNRRIAKNKKPSRSKAWIVGRLWQTPFVERLACPRMESRGRERHRREAR